MIESNYQFSEYWIYKKKLTWEEKVAVGKDISDYYNLASASNEVSANKIVDVDMFSGLSFPTHKVMKMTKTKFKNEFKEFGRLQLGSLKYYQTHEHPEVGDTKEARFVLIGERDDLTVAINVGGGSNARIFCCYDGEPNPETIEKFGYDDSFTIEDPKGFMNEISKTIKAKFQHRSKCVYSKYKVICGPLKKSFNPGVIGQDVLSIIDEKNIS